MSSKATSPFWSAFLTHAAVRGLLPEGYRLHDPDYLNFPSRIAGARWGFHRRAGGIQVNLHFYVPGKPESSLDLFRRVEVHRAETEATLGKTLDCRHGNSGHTLALWVTRTPISAQEVNPAVFDAMLDEMLRFRPALEPWLLG